MADYAINNSLGGTLQSITSTYKTLVAAYSSATPRRIKVYDVEMGTNGTPADNYMEWDISRQTGVGTATTIIPNPLDPADAAALSIGTANYTGEGTITAASSLFYLGINQRASWRWVCAPGGELVMPATANNGFAHRSRSGGYTGTATSMVHFQEQ